MQNSDNFHIFIDVQNFLSDPSYKEELKQQVVNENLKYKYLTYNIKWNNFLTEKITGAFTEVSYNKLCSYITNDRKRMCDESP